MGDNKVDQYARLFGVSPTVVSSILGSGPPPATAPVPSAPAGPAPGDPGFAASMLGAPSTPTMPAPASKPVGPAPGEPGFDISKLPSAPPPAMSATAPSRPVLNIPAGAGQVDLSGAAPKGTPIIRNLPSGAGTVDLSGVTTPSKDGVTVNAPPASADTENAPIVTSPGRYVAAHWQPGTRQEAIEYGMDPEHLAPAMSASDAATGHGLAAGELRLQAAQQEGMADAVYSAARAAAAQRAAQDMKRQEDEKQAYIASEQTKLNDLAQKAAAKVDPEAAKGSLGSQLLATIGVAMGAFGSSLNGGQNQALQMVNANIDRNIRAQEANINNAKASLKDEQSLYKQNLDAFGDRERAVLATKVQYLDQVKALGDAQYAQAKHTMNVADKHEWDQKLMNQRAEVQMQFAKATDDKRTTQSNEHYIPGQVVGGAQLGAKGKEELYVPSLGVYARTKEEAVKMRENSARTENLVRELKTANDIIEEAKTTHDPQKLALLQQKLDGVAARAAVLATVKEGQGAMSEGDKLNQTTGLGLGNIKLGLADRFNPLTPSLSQQQSLIGAALAANQQENGRTGSGSQRGREVYARNPLTGQIEAHQQLSGSNAPTRNTVDNFDDLTQAPLGQSQRAK